MDTFGNCLPRSEVRLYSARELTRSDRHGPLGIRGALVSSAQSMERMHELQKDAKYSMGDRSLQWPPRRRNR